ncbi:hypothetical protein MM_1532 [Methanosarcina mazei Go1]|uniref:Uncharacterized protein n=1 Tax=Methanosarcina mazei (strain ATCC BAA-159 / DSM 3647 / Goe1 / Go1 / JCM 11833 / OCM 88) TaxID=192952 RepID=Q8PWP4_METMA|nr:hypothetical protein MM_1532 [Methanosarcina mazei Go1]
MNSDLFCIICSLFSAVYFLSCLLSQLFTFSAVYFLSCLLSQLFTFLSRLISLCITSSESRKKNRKPDVETHHKKT